MHITLLDGFRVGTTFEKFALIGIVVVAILGLLYAVFLARQTSRAPEGNEKMRHIANAIRTGGNAYLMRQFRTILLVIFALAVFIFFTGWFASGTSVYDNPQWLIGLGRAGGFLMGAIFSATERFGRKGDAT